MPGTQSKEIAKSKQHQTNSNTQSQYIRVAIPGHDIPQECHSQQNDNHSNEYALKVVEVGNHEPGRRRQLVIDKKFVKSQRNDIQDSTKQKQVNHLNRLKGKMLGVFRRKCMMGKDLNYDVNYRQKVIDEHSERGKERPNHSNNDQITTASEYVAKHEAFPPCWMDIMNN